MRALHVVEVIVLAMPLALFLGFTLQEVLWATGAVLRVRENDPSIGLIQAYSGLALWVAGAFAFAILVALAYATIRRRKFRFGALFWIGVFSALVCAIVMYEPFGGSTTLAIVIPAMVLALHAIYVQRKLHAVA